MTFQRVHTTIPVPSPVMSSDDIPRAWFNLPRTLADAQARGMPWWFPEVVRPCPKGHISIKTIYDHGCVACRRDRQALYQYRRRHPATTIAE